MAKVTHASVLHGYGSSKGMINVAAAPIWAQPARGGHPERLAAPRHDECQSHVRVPSRIQDNIWSKQEDALTPLTWCRIMRSHRNTLVSALRFVRLQLKMRRMRTICITDSPAYLTPTRILVPIDFSAASHQLAACALQLAPQAQVVFLSNFDAPAYASVDDLMTHLEEEQDALSRFLSGLPSDSALISYVSKPGTLEQLTQSYANRMRSNLIVLPYRVDADALNLRTRWRKWKTWCAMQADLLLLPCKS